MIWRRFVFRNNFDTFKEILRFKSANKDFMGRNLNEFNKKSNCEFTLRFQRKAYYDYN